MTEGTKSYLIGCHQFLFHPLWVLLAWRLEYKSWPKWWELICIALHDIGICHRQYLSDNNAKKGHWVKGAWWTHKIVTKLYIKNPYLADIAAWVCACHSPIESGFDDKRAKLFFADKRSKLVEPKWWSAFYSLTEPQLKGDPNKWRALVKENLKQESPIGSHELYIKNRKWKK